MCRWNGLKVFAAVVVLLVMVPGAWAVDGKSDYSKAKFTELNFFVETNGSIIAEAKHFTTEGSIMIPGGGYSLHDDANRKELGVTVPSGTDRTFTLWMLQSIAPGDSYLEYHPIDDDRTRIAFSGGAETGLNGRTITWTFPDEPSINGSATVNNFKINS